MQVCQIPFKYQQINDYLLDRYQIQADQDVYQFLEYSQSYLALKLDQPADRVEVSGNGAPRQLVIAGPDPASRLVWREDLADKSLLHNTVGESLIQIYYQDGSQDQCQVRLLAKLLDQHRVDRMVADLYQIQEKFFIKDFLSYQTSHRYQWQPTPGQSGLASYSQALVDRLAELMADLKVHVNRLVAEPFVTMQPVMRLTKDQDLGKFDLKRELTRYLQPGRAAYPSRHFENNLSSYENQVIKQSLLDLLAFVDQRQTQEEARDQASHDQAQGDLSQELAGLGLGQVDQLANLSMDQLAGLVAEKIQANQAADQAQVDQIRQTLARAGGHAKQSGRPCWIYFETRGVQDPVSLPGPSISAWQRGLSQTIHYTLNNPGSGLDQSNNLALEQLAYKDSGRDQAWLLHQRSSLWQKNWQGSGPRFTVFKPQLGARTRTNKHSDSMYGYYGQFNFKLSDPTSLNLYYQLCRFLNGNQAPVKILIQVDLDAPDGNYPLSDLVMREHKGYIKHNFNIMAIRTIKIGDQLLNASLSRDQHQALVADLAFQAQASQDGQLRGKKRLAKLSQDIDRVQGQTRSQAVLAQIGEQLRALIDQPFFDQVNLLDRLQVHLTPTFSSHPHYLKLYQLVQEINQVLKLGETLVMDPVTVNAKESPVLFEQWLYFSLVDRLIAGGWQLDAGHWQQVKDQLARTIDQAGQVDASQQAFYCDLSLGDYQARLHYQAKIYGDKYNLAKERFYHYLTPDIVLEIYNQSLGVHKLAITDAKYQDFGIQAGQALNQTYYQTVTDVAMDKYNGLTPTDAQADFLVDHWQNNDVVSSAIMYPGQVDQMTNFGSYPYYDLNFDQQINLSMAAKERRYEKLGQATYYEGHQHPLAFQAIPVDPLQTASLTNYLRMLMEYHLAMFDRCWYCGAASDQVHRRKLATKRGNKKYYFTCRSCGEFWVKSHCENSIYHSLIKHFDNYIPDQDYDKWYLHCPDCQVLALGQSSPAELPTGRNQDQRQVNPHWVYPLG
ncbi:hypothetical protein SAMN04487985_1169 [Aerococcus urinaehominis]|nr:hypothetical protein [Aerococcus urinaehominis]SDM42492.1 hypothetical protein SAMN04487985_1169 [Aerococcus urinaehominis]